MKKSCFKNVGIRMVCLLLSCLVLTELSLSSCNARKAETEDPSAEVTHSPAPNQSGRILLSSGSEAKLSIVLPPDSNERLLSECRSLQKKLHQLTGAFFTVQYASDAVPAAGQFEILVGNGGRDVSNEVLSEIRYKDYAVAWRSGHVVLASFDLSSAAKAVRYFSDLLEEGHIERADGKVFLLWNADYIHKNISYRPDFITVNGVDLSEYSIVYPAGEPSMLEVAQSLREIVGSRSGYVLPIDTDAKSEQPYEILVGCTNRTQSVSLYQSDAAPKLMEYRAMTLDGKLLFAGGGVFSTLQAVRDFDGYLSAGNGVLDDFSKTKENMIAGIPACEADYRFLSYNVLAEFDGWGSGGNIPADVNIRKEIVASLILQDAPDVVALCEFFDTWRANLPQLVAENYEFVCIDLANGSSNRTPLLYNRNRLRAVESGYTFLEDRPTQNFRAITWAVFEDIKTGFQFAAFSTHLDSQSEALRVDQAKRAAEVVNRICDTYQVSAVFMGDFNSMVGSAPYLEIVNRTGLTRAENESGYTPVDHIFYSPEFTLQKADADINPYTQYASDHKPIYADLIMVKMNGENE